MDRELRTSRYKRERFDKSGNVIKQTLASGTVDGYVSAMIDLYDHQCALGTNHHSHPRGPGLKAILTTRKQGEDVRRRAQYVDRAAGTLQDGYNVDAVERFVRACWTDWFKENGKRNSGTTEAYLRTSADFLLSHSMLLRSQSRLTIQLPDLFSVPLQYQGPTSCNAMILIISNGKTNQAGRIEYGSVVRHKNVLFCTISQVAFYLFYRWNIHGDPLPRFQQRQQWYDMFLFKGRDPYHRLSYETHSQWTGKIYKSINLVSEHLTRRGRAKGAQNAELMGVPENQIRRAGRWNNDALSSSYLVNLPLDFVRATAGFAPHEQGNYYLPRAKIQPPLSLLQALWPWIDE